MGRCWKLARLAATFLDRSRREYDRRTLLSCRHGRLHRSNGRQALGRYDRTKRPDYCPYSHGNSCGRQTRRKFIEEIDRGTRKTGSNRISVIRRDRLGLLQYLRFFNRLIGQCNELAYPISDDRQAFLPEVRLSQIEAHGRLHRVLGILASRGQK